MADLVANVVPSSLDAILWTFASTGVGALTGLTATHYFSQWMPLNPQEPELGAWLLAMLTGLEVPSTPFYLNFQPKYPFGSLTLVQLTVSIYAAAQIMRLIVPAAGESPIGDGTLMFFLLITQPFVIFDVMGLLSKAFCWLMPSQCNGSGSVSQQATHDSPTHASEMAERMITHGSASQDKNEPKIKAVPLPPQLDPSEQLPVTPSPYSYGKRHTAFVNFR